MKTLNQDRGSDAFDTTGAGAGTTILTIVAGWADGRPDWPNDTNSRNKKDTL